jgi:hypothetical protein
MSLRSQIGVVIYRSVGQAQTERLASEGMDWIVVTDRHDDNSVTFPTNFDFFHAVQPFRGNRELQIANFAFHMVLTFFDQLYRPHGQFTMQSPAMSIRYSPASRSIASLSIVADSVGELSSLGSMAGSSKVKRAPWPGWLSTKSWPPCSRMIF